MRKQKLLNLMKLRFFTMQYKTLPLPLQKMLKLIADHPMSLTRFCTPLRKIHLRKIHHVLTYPPQLLTRVRYHLFVQILQEFGMLPVRISGPTTPPFRHPYLAHSTTLKMTNMW